MESKAVCGNFRIHFPRSWDSHLHTTVLGETLERHVSSVLGYSTRSNAAQLSLPPPPPFLFLFFFFRVNLDNLECGSVTWGVQSWALEGMGSGPASPITEEYRESHNNNRNYNFFIVFNWSLMEGNDEYIKIFLFRHVHGEYRRETMGYSGFAGTYNLPKESRAARTPLGWSNYHAFLRQYISTLELIL